MTTLTDETSNTLWYDGHHLKTVKLKGLKVYVF